MRRLLVFCAFAALAACSEAPRAGVESASASPAGPPLSERFDDATMADYRAATIDERMEAVAYAVQVSLTAAGMAHASDERFWEIAGPVQSCIRRNRAPDPTPLADVYASCLRETLTG